MQPPSPHAETGPSCPGLAQAALTALAVQHELGLELAALVQRVADLPPHELSRVGPVEEGAGAAALHHLSAREARQVAEAIRAVDHGRGAAHLRVAQHEVAVCKTRGRGQGAAWPRCGMGTPCPPTWLHYSVRCIHLPCFFYALYMHIHVLAYTLHVFACDSHALHTSCTSYLYLHEFCLHGAQLAYLSAFACVLRARYMYLLHRYCMYLHVVCMYSACMCVLHGSCMYLHAVCVLCIYLCVLQEFCKCVRVYARTSQAVACI